MHREDRALITVAACVCAGGVVVAVPSLKLILAKAKDSSRRTSGAKHPGTARSESRTSGPSLLLALSSRSAVRLLPCMFFFFLGPPSVHSTFRAPLAPDR